MNTRGRLCNKYHERAMDLCEYAWLNEHKKGDPRITKRLYRQAHRFESRAARIALSLRSVKSYKILLESAQSIWQDFLDS